MCSKLPTELYERRRKELETSIDTYAAMVKTDKEEIDNMNSMMALTNSWLCSARARLRELIYINEQLINYNNNTNK